MTVYGPSARTSSGVYMASTRDVYTAVYWPCTRPCTRDVYGRVHVSTCLRVQGPCTRPCYTPHGRVRAIYTAENGRLHDRTRPCIQPCTGRIGSCTWQCTGRVHGLFGRVHWPCTLSFSAVYIARTRPCNGPCTWPLHGRVQGQSGPCIRQVGLPGRVHVPRRHAMAVCGPLRHTVRVRRRVHGPCRRTCTRLCIRPCTTAVTRPSDTCIRLHRS